MRPNSLLTPMMVLIAAKAGGAVCTLPTTFSLSATNTINGTELKYKRSDSPTIRTVLFEGLNLSSTQTCGDTYQECSILSLNIIDGIIAVVLPLGQYFGFITFDANLFILREKHVIRVQTSLDCELNTFYMLPIPQELMAVCQGQGTDLYLACVHLDVTNLTMSYPFPVMGLNSCPAADPSKFVFFLKSNDVLLVFVDENGFIYFKRQNQMCQEFDDLQVCSGVERFVGISQDQQAIYCPTQTYLLDLNKNSNFPTFSRSRDGYPMFCTNDMYCSSRNNELVLRSVSDRTVLRVPTEFPYADDVMWGECVVIANQFVVVVQLRNRTVVTANLNQSDFMELGVSETPPRLFDQFAFLSNTTHTVIHSLFNSDFKEVIGGNSVLGFVMSNGSTPVMCTSTTTGTMTPLTPSPELSVSPAAIATPVVVVVVVVMVLLILLAIICICYVRRKKKLTNQSGINIIAEKGPLSSFPPEVCKPEASDTLALGELPSMTGNSQAATPSKDSTPGATTSATSQAATPGKDSAPGTTTPTDVLPPPSLYELYESPGELPTACNGTSQDATPSAPISQAATPSTPTSQAATPSAPTSLGATPSAPTSQAATPSAPTSQTATPSAPTGAPAATTLTGLLKQTRHEEKWEPYINAEDINITVVTPIDITTNESGELQEPLVGHDEAGPHPDGPEARGDDSYGDNNYITDNNYKNHPD